MRPAATSAAFVLLVGFLGLACSAAAAEDCYFREGPLCGSAQSDQHLAALRSQPGASSGIAGLPRSTIRPSELSRGPTTRMIRRSWMRRNAKMRSGR